MAGARSVSFDPQDTSLRRPQKQRLNVAGGTRELQISRGGGYLGSTKPTRGDLLWNSWACPWRSLRAVRSPVRRDAMDAPDAVTNMPMANALTLLIPLEKKYTFQHTRPSCPCPCLVSSSFVSSLLRLLCLHRTPGLPAPPRQHRLFFLLFF